jgi:hypothetical protein
MPGNRRKLQGTSPDPGDSTMKQFLPFLLTSLQLRNSDTGTPRRSHSRYPGVVPSHIKGYAPKDYNTQGLYAYLRWCLRKYVNTGYLDIYDKMAEEELGIDLFYMAMESSTKAKTLIEDMKAEAKVKSGMAQRLVDDFVRWFEDDDDDIEFQEEF